MEGVGRADTAMKIAEKIGVGKPDDLARIFRIAAFGRKQRSRFLTQRAQGGAAATNQTNGRDTEKTEANPEVTENTTENERPLFCSAPSLSLRLAIRA